MFANDSEQDGEADEHHTYIQGGHLSKVYEHYGSSALQDEDGELACDVCEPVHAVSEHDATYQYAVNRVQ